MYLSPSTIGWSGLVPRCIVCTRTASPDMNERPTASTDAPRKRTWFRGGLVFEAHRLLYHSAKG